MQASHLGQQRQGQYRGHKDRPGHEYKGAGLGTRTSLLQAPAPGTGWAGGRRQDRSHDSSPLSQFRLWGQQAPGRRAHTVLTSPCPICMGKRKALGGHWTPSHWVREWPNLPKSHDDWRPRSGAIILCDLTVPFSHPRIFYPPVLKAYNRAPPRPRGQEHRASRP